MRYLVVSLVALLLLSCADEPKPPTDTPVRPNGDVAGLAAWQGADGVPISVGFDRNLSSAEARSLLGDGYEVEVVYSTLFGRNGTISIPESERRDPAAAFELARHRAMDAMDPANRVMECRDFLDSHESSDLDEDPILLQRAVWLSARHSTATSAMELLEANGPFIAGLRIVAPDVPAARRLSEQRRVQQFRPAQRVADGRIHGSITPTPDDRLNSRQLAQGKTGLEAWQAVVACAETDERVRR